MARTPKAPAEVSVKPSPPSTKEQIDLITSKTPSQEHIGLGNVLRIILGILFIIGGIAVIFYGYQTWTSSSQLSNATSPSFVTTASVSALESIGMYVLGILMIILGGFIIGRDATISVLEVLHALLPIEP